MSTKCFTCNEPIVNADFIKCEGTCAEKFHSKCVALNKTTLNAVTSCPNIHWFCHECNNGTKAIGTSIDNMKQSVDNLTKSLSSDLLSGFKILTDTLASSLKSIHHSSIGFVADTSNPSKRRRNEEISESEPEGQSTTRKKRFIDGSNNNQNGLSLAAAPVPNRQSDERRRSIVVSNISKGISSEYLTNYLSTELQIDGSNIRTTLLKSARIADENIKFLQFRVSIPENLYSKVRDPETWPTGVRVRDYVFNRQGGDVLVSKENFLSKRPFHTPVDHPPVQPIATAAMTTATPMETTTTANLIQLTEETRDSTITHHPIN